MIRESRNVVFQNIIYSCLPNVAGRHFCHTINAYGNAERLKMLKTSELPIPVLKLILQTRPWARNKILESLQRFGATKILAEIGEKNEQ